MLNDKPLTREELIHKLEVLPDEQLSDVAHFLDHLEKKRIRQDAPKSAMDFAGAWEDMDTQAFDEMLGESRQRRNQAFSDRPER